MPPSTEPPAKTGTSSKAFLAAALTVIVATIVYATVYWGDLEDAQKFGLGGLVAAIFITLAAGAWKDNPGDRVSLDYLTLAVAVIPIAALVGGLLVPDINCEPIETGTARRVLGVGLFVAFYVFLIVGWFAQRREAETATEAHHNAMEEQERQKREAEERVTAAKTEAQALAERLKVKQAELDAALRVARATPADHPERRDTTAATAPTLRDVVGVVRAWARNALRR